MRVLVLTNLYPSPLHPNLAPFNRWQFRLLGANHCPVRVIAPVSWTDELRAHRSGKKRLPASRQVLLDGLAVDHPRVYYVPRMLRSWYGQFYFWSVKKLFHRVVREFEPTIICAPWIYPDGWAAVKLAREVGLPVVLKAHGSDVLLLPKYPGRRAGTVAALKEADGIVAVSQDLADKMVALGAHPNKVRVVYNGLDTRLFCPGSKIEARKMIGLDGPGPHLLFVGNLLPVKGIDVLLRACARLEAEGQPVRLHIVGEGSLRGNLMELSHSLGIANRVQWHGSITQSELPNWYRAADLFMLASRSEGVPNVLLEASSCHTPWVATKVGGIPEIAHFGMNRLVSAESSDELADAIREMLGAQPSIGETPRSQDEAVQEIHDFLSEVESSFGRDLLATCGS